MAAYSVNVAKHATLTANTVDTVTLTAGVPHVEVVNRTGTSEIYFKVATTTPADPTIGGDDCYVVPAIVGSYTVPVPEGGAIVKLISAGAMAYSVIGGEA